MGKDAHLIGRATVLRVIRDLATRLDELCKTEGDLSQNIGIVSSDCIGELSSNFDRFLEKLRSMIQQLEGIADGAQRVGILGIDASIEASHAGASGRGFTVVAGEIGKLAESAGRNSAAINGQLKEVIQEEDKLAVEEVTMGVRDISHWPSRRTKSSLSAHGIRLEARWRRSLSKPARFSADSLLVPGMMTRSTTSNSSISKSSLV